MSGVHDNDIKVYGLTMWDMGPAGECQGALRWQKMCLIWYGSGIVWRHLEHQLLLGLICSQCLATVDTHCQLHSTSAFPHTVCIDYIQTKLQDHCWEISNQLLVLRRDLVMFPWRNLTMPHSGKKPLTLDLHSTRLMLPSFLDFFKASTMHFSAVQSPNCVRK